MKTKHYHNTNNLSIKEFLKAQKANMKQEEVVRFIFNNTMFKNLTASEVWEHFKIYKNVPLTSIRRAMSNLQRQGYLFKLSKTKTGIYGKPEHFYTTIKARQ